MESETELKVGDVMTKGVIYVRPDENIQKVAQIIKKNDIDSVLVIEDGKGKGIITDRDIILKVVAEGKHPKSTLASDVMTSPLLTIAPNVGIEEAARMMRDKGVRRFAVKEDDNIIGVFSEFDLVRVEPAMHLLIKEHSRFDVADLSARVGTISGTCESCGNYSENLMSVDGKLLCGECASR